MNEEPNFVRFGLLPALLEGIRDLGFETPTPIQSEAIGALMSGRDVIGRARTGSGKTAGFGLPLLHRVHEGGPVRALVLAPTRELAIQVSDALRDLGKHLKISAVTIYGGASYEPQLRALKRGATIVVGTPGRVIDLMGRGALDLSRVEYFVLDEADEMLRMGFIDDVEAILARLPSERQVALFSATMPEAIRKVAQTYLRDPLEIQVEDAALTVDHIDQKFVRVTRRDKDRALLRLLAGTRSAGTLVFARTRARCADTAAMLIANGIAADALHGDLNQGARERVLGRLRAKALDVVVATDVAARGLDVEHLTHVINYDMPDDTEMYVHRIGRTARAGREGTAITLVEPSERRRAQHMEKSLGARIPLIDLPSDDEIAASRRAELVDLIHRELQNPELVEVRRWVRGVLAERGWSAEDVASAALHLLGKERNFEFVASPTETPVVKGEINECEIVVSLGRRDGIRPADIVGAFTNDLGVAATQIGRISLGSRAAYVGLPRQVADLLLAAHPTIELRGTTAKLRPNTQSSGNRSTSEPREKKRFGAATAPGHKGAGAKGTQKKKDKRNKDKGKPKRKDREA